MPNNMTKTRLYWHFENKDPYECVTDIAIRKPPKITKEPATDWLLLCNSPKTT